MAHGKRYRQQYAKVDRDRAYPPAEAVSLLKETASAGFDETVELHIRLGVNVRHAEEQLRGTLALPHGLGKEVTIAVFAQGEKARDAEAAGADFVGADDLAKRIEDGWTDFDVAIATPDMMPTVGKLGRILGPQGKMPNPKVGTVTDDVEKAVSESKSGKVEYRTDRQAVVHLAIGKASFEGSHLLDNYNAVIEEINRAKPAAAKGRYIITVTLATAMGPGIRVDSTKVGERAAAASEATAEASAPEAPPEGGEGSGEEEAVPA
ncbi:MAG: 50S ribosomal protein L1 [Solirubrobacterales bacterium]